MARDAQQIREEIEETRGQLGHTLEAIGDRVSPRHVVEDLAEKVSPRRLVRRQTEKMKEGISNVGDTMKSKANGAVNGVVSATPTLNRSTTTNAGASRPTLPKVDLRAKERASDIKDGVTDRAQTVTGKVRQISASAADQVRSAPDNAPLVAGAVAFGAGLAVALAVRASSGERQVASSVGAEIAPPLKARASRVKESIRSEFEPKVRGGVKRVKRTAAGATARIKAEAGEASAEVRKEVRDDAAETAQALRKSTRRVTTAAKSKAHGKPSPKGTSGPRSTRAPARSAKRPSQSIPS